MFNIQEFIFDGVSNSPDVPNQGMDMHSFYDGQYIWYPYADYSNQPTTGIEQKIIKYNPSTNGATVTALASSGAEQGVVYQAIQGNDSDTIWLYSTYTTRALWKFTKSTGASEYISLSAFIGGLGGKICSLMIGGIEHIVATIVTNGYPVAYNTDTEALTELTELGLTSYGCQTDGTNIFIAQDTVIKSFTLDSAHTVSNVESISAIGAIDIAWDGTELWTASRSVSSNTTMIENFLPVYTADVVTSFERKATHYTGSPDKAQPASVKANDNYIAVAWEGSSDGTLGWSILDRSTGSWTDFWNAATQNVSPEAVYPFSSQYWTTVTIEIDVPDAIYVAGYAPFWQGDYGFGNDTAFPDKSMRLLKLIPSGSMLVNGTLSDGTLSSN